MAEVVTVGETMAVLTPGGNGPLRYHVNYRMRMAGAESNTAVGISKLGHTAAWMSAVGEDELGHYVLNSIRAEGVDCTGVQMDGRHRTGLMFKETGGRETKVYYYRENSAASHLNFSRLDQRVLRNARVLHLTGITPALSPSCMEMAEELIRYARKHGILLSFDPNIRKRLWGERDYGPCIREMVRKADIVLMGLDEGEALFGTREMVRLLDAVRRDGFARYVAIKDGGRGAIAAEKEEVVRIPPHPCRPVDPVGAGDAFNAGFLCGILEGRDIGTCGRMGGFAGAMATETMGDIEGCPSREQMDLAMAGEQEIFR